MYAAYDLFNKNLFLIRFKSNNSFSNRLKATSIFIKNH